MGRGTIIAALAAWACIAHAQQPPKPPPTGEFPAAQSFLVTPVTLEAPPTRIFESPHTALSTSTRTRPDDGLIIGGSTMWLSAAVLDMLLSCAFVEEARGHDDFMIWAFVPFVGPFMQATMLPDFGMALGMGMLGGAQILGAVLLLVGLLCEYPVTESTSPSTSSTTHNEHHDEHEDRDEPVEHQVENGPRIQIFPGASTTHGSVTVRIDW
jgi:hypothetical protein